jgi:tRNA (guanine-N7-)-methyltransferase
MTIFFPSFSRRIGKSLRNSQKQLLAEVLPALSISLPTDETVLLPESPGLWMEIGFGSGEHLAAQALNNPSISFIGCEPYINGVVQLLKAITSQKLENIRLWQDDARLLLAKLPDHSLERVFILFPDPWPKKKHNRRRIISDAMLDLLANKMAPGAELRVATDHEDYAAWILEHLARHPLFSTNYRYPDDWHIPPADWVKTRYQEKAEAEGIPAKFFCFTRKY